MGVRLIYDFITVENGVEYEHNRLWYTPEYETWKEHLIKMFCRHYNLNYEQMKEVFSTFNSWLEDFEDSLDDNDIAELEEQFRDEAYQYFFGEE